jgi:hypothetical protein
MSNIYRGGMPAYGDLAVTEDQIDRETVDLSASQDANAVRLEGETGQAYAEVGSAVPNLKVTRVSRPARIRTEPSDLQTSSLTAGRRGRRGK